MGKYLEYRKVQVGELKELPSHWMVSKFARVSYMKGRIGWQGLKQSEFTKEGPYLITGMNFKDGRIRWDEVYHIPQERYDEAPEIQLRHGDVLMTKDGTIGKLLFVDHLPGPASLNSHLLLLRPLDEVYYPKYLYYQLQSKPFLHHVEMTKTGTTFYGITQEAVGQYKIILPPIEEQEAIAAYLDEKTTLIDDTISKKQRLIELLQEERTALINQVVTRGLDPNVTMKPSGVEWLGEVPAHWQVKKLGLLLSYLSYGFTSPMPVTSEGVYMITAYDIRNSVVDYTSARFTSHDAVEKLTDKCKPVVDDILITKDGTLGRIALYRGEFPLCINQSVALLRPRKEHLLPELLATMLMSFVYQAKIKEDAGGTTIKHIYISRLAKMPFAYPPNSQEQAGLLKALVDIELKVSTTLTKLFTEVQLLQEYRTALINEVVTGKRCVVPQPEVLAAL